MQLPENACQAALAVVLCLSAKWFSGGLHALAALYFLHLFSTRQQMVEPTDVFKRLPQLRSQRVALFAFYILTFCVVTFRCG